VSGPAGLPRERLTVAVPIYRAGLDADEEVSLASTFRALGGHHLVMVKPEGLDTSALEARFPFAGAEAFAPEFFRSVAGYNRLLLSAPFYDRFRASEYLLVCQLDVFVFRDDLAGWVARGHDYVGAPWLSGSAASLALHWLKFRASRLLPGAAGRIHPYELRGQVGNGGFSLRRVETHRRLAAALADRIAHYLASEGTHHFHEDVFWSLEPARQGLPHRRPSADEALAFAFDVNPAAAFRRAGGRLPMAAHGWYKGRHRAFWAPHVAAAAGAPR
jgi:hypothetical protein